MTLYMIPNSHLTRFSLICELEANSSLKKKLVFCSVIIHIFILWSFSPSSGISDGESICKTQKLPLLHPSHLHLVKRLDSGGFIVLFLPFIASWWHQALKWYQAPPQRCLIYRVNLAVEKDISGACWPIGLSILYFHKQELHIHIQDLIYIPQGWFLPTASGHCCPPPWLSVSS